MGLKLLDRGWDLEAMAQFEKAIDKDPEFAPAYDNIANLYAEKGEHLKALGLYLRALEADSDDATIHYNFGCFLTNYGAELAKTAYETATLADDEFPEAHYQLGVTLASEGQWKAAAREFRIACEQDPENTEMRFELAKALLKLDRMQEAVSQLRKIVAIDESNSAAWFELGSCYFRQGLYSEARLAMEQAIR
jgi:Tfp pilus assembly protein PilF